MAFLTANSKPPRKKARPIWKGEGHVLGSHDSPNSDLSINEMRSNTTIPDVRVQVAKAWATKTGGIPVGSTELDIVDYTGKANINEVLHESDKDSGALRVETVSEEQKAHASHFKHNSVDTRSSRKRYLEEERARVDSEDEAAKPGGNEVFTAHTSSKRRRKTLHANNMSEECLMGDVGDSGHKIAGQRSLMDYHPACKCTICTKRRSNDVFSKADAEARVRISERGSARTLRSGKKRNFPDEGKTIRQWEEEKVRLEINGIEDSPSDREVKRYMLECSSDEEEAQWTEEEDEP